MTYLSVCSYLHYVFCFRIKRHEEEEEKRKKNEEKDAEEIKRQNLLYEIEMKKKLSKKQEEINESRKLFFVSEDAIVDQLYSQMPDLGTTEETPC